MDIKPWTEVEAEGRNLVVLADPGLGKTRLLHLRAQQLARAGLSGLENGFAPEELDLPVLVRCDELHAHPKESLEEACVEILAVAENQSPAFADWLLSHLKSTPNTFLLDALDEIPERTASLPLGHRLERWTDRSTPGRRLIITSRIAGYERPQGPDLTEVELQPFSPDDVRAYVDAWGLDRKSHTKVLRQLENPSFMGLARIPLLLAFICAVAGQPESLPRSRKDLYDRMLDQLLGEQHRLRERQDTTPRKRLKEAHQKELRRILPQIALHFATSPKGWVDRMPATELEQAIAATQPRIKDVLGKCENTGILTRAGVERLSDRPPYFFLHRTFAEYLTATAVAATEDGWSTALREHLWFDQDWDQILPLIGACLHDPRPYLGQLLSVRPDYLHRGLHTAARVIAELTDDQASLVQDQIREVSSRLLRLLAVNLPEATESLQAMADRIPDSRARDIAALLHHPGIFGRDAAIRILARRDGDDATQALLTAIADPEPEVRMVAAYALGGRDGEDVTAGLLTALGDSSFWVRHGVMQALGDRDGHNVTAGLLTALTNPNPEVRRAAALALGSRDGHDVTAALLTALTNPNPEVRQAAGYALDGRDGRDGENVTAALLNALTDPEPEVRRTAAQALGNRDGHDVTAPLRKALTDDSDPEVRRAAARSLGSRDGQDVTASLLNALTTDPNPWVRHDAAQAVGGRDSREVTAALLDALTDPNPWVRHDAAQALGGRDSQDVTTALLDALTDPEPEVRRAAARSLGSRNGHDVTTALLNALTDPNPWVRQAVVRALGGRDGENVTTALLTALTDPEPEVRQTAAAILPGRPAQTVIAGLAAQIGALNTDQALKIYSGLSPLAWSMNTMNATDRNELVSLLGVVTDSIPSCDR
ncbi:hypothetical protein GCM10023081_17150 [Arthrobacter ginkgonis]|uniref:NACHT domain-containing protein n=1 Tax=Arthrobacter ginkgonis TaxID=1630594 RepID=A0ABP7C926_9MICC